MAKHRKGKHHPSFTSTASINKRLQPTSLLCILALHVESNSAEPTRGIVICIYTRQAPQDASVYMRRSLSSEVFYGVWGSQ